MPLNARIEVVGAGDGQTFAIPEDQIVRVGSAAAVEIAFPDDRRMSLVHFSLYNHDGRCELHDLDSTTGTFVNGRNAGHALLADGDEIRAGQTVIRFLASLLELPRVAFPGQGHDLKQLLATTFQPLYGLLDAARDRRVLELLEQSEEQYQSLYEGPQGEELADYAPYLVRLFDDSPLLDALIDEGWGRSWGVFFKCPQSFLQVRHHFRHFLSVQDEKGEEYYFRFYDPRVIRPLLPACTRLEREEFFGPVETFIMESESPGRMQVFAPSGEAWETEVTSNMASTEAHV
jgi:hypothetical protein